MHDPSVMDSAGDGVLRWGGAFKRLHGTRAPRRRRSGEVFGVCGAACLMPTAVFDELGGFDEDFFASHEDVDLSYRARLLGYRCRYVADAVVRHHGSATLGAHERVRGLPRPAQPRVDVHEEHAGSHPAADAARPPALLRPRRRATSPGSACSGRSCGPSWRRSPACRACCVSGPPCSARGAWAPARSGRCSNRAGSPPSCSEKRFDVGLAGGTAVSESAPQLTAILVNYNAGDELRTALASIAAEMAGRAWEGHVVDNASVDGSAAIAREFLPEVTLHRQPRERRLRAGGQPGARARARAARAHHEPRLPARAGRPGDAARRAARGHAPCAMAGPRILDPDGSVQGSARGDPDMLTGLFGRSTGAAPAAAWLPVSRRNVVDAAAPPGAPARVVDWVSARACWPAATRWPRSAASTSATSCTGRTPISAAVCARAGAHVRYVPAATAVHRVGHSSRTARASSVRAFHESAYLYYATHVAPGALDPSGRWRRCCSPPMLVAAARRRAAAPVPGQAAGGARLTCRSPSPIRLPPSRCGVRSGGSACCRRS